MTHGLDLAHGGGACVDLVVGSIPILSCTALLCATARQLSGGEFSSAVPQLGGGEK